jgi:hypothetical protein
MSVLKFYDISLLAKTSVTSYWTCSDQVGDDSYILAMNPEFLAKLPGSS